MKYRIIFILTFGLLSACSEMDMPIDKQATQETAYLYQQLKDISKTSILFGHQDDQAYGVGWRAVEGQSDVKSAVGKYPAVHGWDLGKDLTSEMNIDSVQYSDMKRWIQAAYERGGINTASFHMDNLTTGGDSWDKTPSAKDILPGGSKHAAFLEQLDLLAGFFQECGVPFVFRPWHEHNGNWFWWGKGLCTEEEYIQLYRFTVDYIKNEKGIHHLLYAYSPDRSRMSLDSAEQSYLYGYPGDDYVDIIGLDNYWDVRDRDNYPSEERIKNYTESLKVISALAEKKNKVAALTETGNEGVQDSVWFTQMILNPIKENKESINLAWVLVWRNSNLPGHYYVPFGDHPAMADFRKFEQEEMTLFESDLEGKMYSKPL